MKNTLPPPDTSALPSYSDLSVVEIIFSLHKNFRAVIARDRRGILHVRQDKWELGDYDFIGKGYWSQDDQGATFTDTLELARELAIEKLRGTPDGYKETETEPSG